MALAGCENRDVLVRRADQRPEFRELLEVRDRFGGIGLPLDGVHNQHQIRKNAGGATLDGPYSPDSLDRRMRAIQKRYSIRESVPARAVTERKDT